MKLHPEHPAVKIIRFPDGQPHIRLVNPERLPADVDITWRIRNPEELYLLACLHSALDEYGICINDLTIPYLMAARSDRVMVPGDAFGLGVVASVINRIGCNRLFVLDPHSRATQRLVTGATSIDPDFLLVGIKAGALVLPDEGSKVHSERRQRILRARYRDICEVACAKTRDLKTGNLVLTVENPEVAIGKDVVVVDDICDGGATFIAIAKQLPGVRSLKLVVTHGIFSKGFGELAPAFHQIICSDSYASSYPNQPANLTVIPCNL